MEELSSMHIIKRSDQWNDRAVRTMIIPRGCLCVELTPDHETKIKVGEGDKTYEQLPYIGVAVDISKYFTKEQVAQLIRDTVEDIFNDLNKRNKYVRLIGSPVARYDLLPKTGNTEGDIRFVTISDSKDPTSIYAEYIWFNNRWELIGAGTSNSDLSGYVTKEEFNRVIASVNRLNTEVNELQKLSHTHTNKTILDGTSATYTTEKDTKLAGIEEHANNYTLPNATRTQVGGVKIGEGLLIDAHAKLAVDPEFIEKQEYDDTELKERLTALEEDAHTHSNKAVLDETTAAYTIEEKTKLATLENYDDTEITSRVSDLEDVAHTHDNKSVLDETTASYTTEEKEKLAELENYDDTEITSRVSDLEADAHTHTNKSILDLVEEPYTTAEKTKLASLENYTLPTASSDTLGGVKVGNGLSIDSDGVLSATGGSSSGGGNYTEGDAIEFRDSAAGIPITNIRFFATNKRGTDTYFQMSELEFYDASDNLITFSDVAAYIGESSSTPNYPVASDNVTKLFDGDTTTKMCCYWAADGIRVDMTLASAITGDLLKTYRYCTGNDFPARDPVSWNVFASSDNGTTWFKIDTRSNATVPSTRNAYTDRFGISIGTQSINIKYGNGLTLDQNGALTVIDTGQEYVAGDGISIDEGSPATDVTSLAWEQGSINPTNGEPDDLTLTVIRSPMIEVGLTNMLNVSAQATDDSDMRWEAAFYDSNSEFISITTTWQTLSDEVICPGNAKYVIILLRKEAETEIDENSLKACEISWPIEIGKYVITNTGVTHAELESSAIIITENGETKTLLTFGQDLDVTNGVVSIPDYHRLVLNVEE